MGTRHHRAIDNQNKFHESMKQTNNCNNNGIMKDQLNMQKLKPYLWARKMNRVQEFQDKASLDMDDGAQEKKTLERFYWLKGVAKACWWLWTSASTSVMLCVVFYEYNIIIESKRLHPLRKVSEGLTSLQSFYTLCLLGPDRGREISLLSGFCDFELVKSFFWARQSHANFQDGTYKSDNLTWKHAEGDLHLLNALSRENYFQK